MDERSVREQLVKLLEGAHAHVTLEQTIEAFPVDQINVHVDDIPYSAWSILEHLRLTQQDILDYITAENYREPEFPSGYWPAPGTEGSEANWIASTAAFIKDRQALQTLAQDPDTDLTAPLPHNSQHTIFRELLIIGNHNSYHLGQLLVLKRLLTGKRIGTAAR